MNDTRQLIRVGHSPDPDDAFMFFALAKDRIPTGEYRFEHELVDIETLNRRAFSGELELTAVSVHAYAHLSDQYVLCNSGASMGDRYGPMLVARSKRPLADFSRATIAVPGTLTTAFLVLRMCLGPDFQHVVVPFDEILDVVAAGSYEGTTIDAGLIIHEGQLTYGQQDLELIVDTGQWWFDETGLPLPLGANALRKDLGPETICEVHRLLLASIRYALEHREEALSYALGFGRGLNHAKADQFVEMYVNDWTLDFGPRGRKAVAELLTRGHRAGVIPELIEPEFVGVPGS
ncbi:MAG: ABC transporter substrate-binding protein [Candidatus Nealsonbacteria bacterium]|nr:ABC transporter substrate-binding protein [Candidatus Nealsonbacteria bacterium]